MNVNSKVDATVTFRELPGLYPHYQTSWKIRLIQIGASCVPLALLYDWHRFSKSGYVEMMKGLRVVGTTQTPPFPCVKKSTRTGLFEIIPVLGKCGLVYYYDRAQATAVVTSGYCLENETEESAHISAASVCERFGLLS